MRDPTDTLYCGLMEELKIRLRTVIKIIPNEKSFAGAIARECSYLQLRMSCEVIALACLVSHGSLPGANQGKIRKQYKASDIMRMLEKINEDHFPHPGELLREGGNLQFAQREERITKQGFLKFYGEIGDELHRGSLKKLLASTAPRAEDLKDAQKWAADIWNHMAGHRIAMPDRSQLLCMMGDIDGRQKVTSARTA